MQGSYYLLYFGFSLCPDVCPISLMKLSNAVRLLKNSKEGKQFFKIRPVFVSVNPEIDTPDKLKEFLQIYNDPSLLCLTGESSKSP